MNKKLIAPRWQTLAIRIGAARDRVPDALTDTWQWVQTWIVTPWTYLQPLFKVLFYCRFSVGVVAIATGLLWFSAQGREIAIRVGDDLVQTVLAVIGAFFWAFHSWFDGRRVLRRRFGPNRGAEVAEPHFNYWVNAVPRFLGSAAYLVAASSALIAWFKLGFTFQRWHGLLVVLNLAFAVLFFYLMKFRRVLQGKLLGPDKESVLDLVPWITPVTWTYSVVLFLAATLIPVRFGFWAGALGIVFFALSSIVFFGSWLVRETTPPWSQDAKHPNAGASTFPVMTALVTLAVVLTFWPWNDNHHLRTQPMAPDSRPGVEQFFNAWKNQAPTLPPENADGKPYQPMVVVATAGGGIRAGYWTAVVLGKITDAAPKFRNALFAISGVSGGSVGAAFYTATLRELGQGCAEATAKGVSQAADCITKPVLQSLSQEFLAPVVARMLYPDLMQRFLPVAVLPDRATALSAAWQESWQSSVAQPRTLGLDAALASLLQVDSGMGKEWLPALLLNSTHVETGQRVIASSLALDKARLRDDPAIPAFLNAVDLQKLIKADVTLGTAALNSARFTYVSPPATLPCADSSWISFCRNGHVVDGGYFENFGAVTAKQLLDAAPLPGLGEPASVRPIVILISNDAGLGTKIEDDVPPQELPSQGVANETLAPVRTLLNTRDSRGILAAKELRASVPRENFFHFRMLLKDGQVEPALGWALDKSSEQQMRNMLTCREANHDQYLRLLKILGVPQERWEALARCDEGSTPG